MEEYIERDAAVDAIVSVYVSTAGYKTRECVWTAKEAVCALPTADVVPVVRCKDCVWCEDQGMSGLYCNHPDNRNPCGCRPNDFCNDGERKDGDGE